MKKLLFLALLLGAGLGVYSLLTGHLPWNPVSNEEQQLIQIQETARTAFSQFREDPSNVSDCLSRVEQAERDLNALRPQLKSPDDKTAAAILASDIAKYKQEMH